MKDFNNELDSCEASPKHLYSCGSCKISDCTMRYMQDFVHVQNLCVCVCILRKIVRGKCRGAWLILLLNESDIGRFDQVLVRFMVPFEIKEDIEVLLK